MTDRVTGREIILSILENMQEGLEPLFYTTLAPGLYDVYLHVDDYERLEGILPLIIDEAKAALDKAIDDSNRNAKGRNARAKRWKLPIPGKAQEPEMTFLKPAGGWGIAFHQNVDEDVNPGDLVIESTLALPEKPGMGAGIETRRIRTIRSGGVSRVVSTIIGSSPGDTTNQAAAAQVETVAPGTSTKRPDEKAFARIRWSDKRGPQTFLMTTNQIVAGRGGSDHYVHLRLEGLPDISREHFRLRRDEQTGEFFIRDLSTYGTAMNGKKLPSSIEEINGTRRDINREEPLPRKASIRLADALTLEFEAMEEK